MRSRPKKFDGTVATISPEQVIPEGMPEKGVPERLSCSAALVVVLSW